MSLAYEYHRLLKAHAECAELGELQEEDIPVSDKDRRVFMVLLLDLLQCPDMELKALRQQIDQVVHDTIVAFVYNLLARIAQFGVKPLQDFLELQIVELMVSPSAPMDEGKIRRDSIMGLYIRRMLLAYNEMSFSQVVDMFHRVKNYYEAGFPETMDENHKMRRLKSLDFREAGPLSLAELEARPNTSSLEPLDSLSVFSRKQAEYFMARQAQMLDHNQWEALPPDQLQGRLRDILSANPDIAEAHFLSYMNSLRVKEYCTALHSLYHFFDRKACTSIDGSPTKKKSAPVQADEVAMRYAALNLASLQFRFGNKDECRVALNEAIMLAQEGNDQVCLQHALVWLNLLEGNDTSAPQLERSIKKTIDLSLPSLTVHGLNCLNKALGMGTELPSRVIYYFTQSNLINCMHSSYGMMVSGCAQRAAMWNYYGKRQLCALDSLIVLHLDTSINGVYYNGQAICIAMCNLAQQHADTGDYPAANEILSQAKQQFPPLTSEADKWKACQQRVAFSRAIYNGRWRDAEQAVVNLQAVDEAEAKIRKAVLLREQGEITQAFQCLNRLLSECEEEKSVHHVDFKCRVLLELSSVYFRSGEPSSAMLYVTDCLACASQHHLELLESLAMAYLAYIQLNMDLPVEASRLLESRLIRILSHANSYDKARYLHLYACCKVAAARSGAEGAPANATAELEAAARLMPTVTQLFHSVEAHLKEKDALHFQSVLHHALMGDHGDGHQHSDVDRGEKGAKHYHQQERNRCARQFKILDKLYPTLGPVIVL